MSMQAAKLRTRLCAIVYDFLIILFISTIVVFAIQVIVVGDNELAPDHILNKILKPLWFVPGFFYLAYYWTKTGQTPSMRVWKIKAVNRAGDNMTWTQAFIRYLSSFLGLGCLWCLFNKERQGTQDLMSGTRLVQTK